MMHTREYDLTLAVLHYASSCLETGDWAELRDLNFSEREVAALQDLTLGDIHLLADHLTGHALTIQLDRERFWLMLSEIEQERATEQLKNEMVCRDAPADMMRYLFSMGGREYTALRRRNRRPRYVGRPNEPDAQTQEVIWRAWKRRGGLDAPTAHEWLTIADESDIDLRTVWRFIQSANAMERAL